jgi:hypothetical protein
LRLYVSVSIMMPPHDVVRRNIMSATPVVPRKIEFILKLLTKF